MMTVVAVPAAMAADLIQRCSEHVEWEEFARLRLSQGSDLRQYYPLTAAVEDDDRAWKDRQPKP